MVQLMFTVLIASLAGSLHCAGMCGAFSAMSVGTGEAAAWKRAVAYHGGRLVTYVLLGGLAGTLGAAMNLAGYLMGIEPVALVVAGGSVVLFGVVSLLRTLGVRVSIMRLPAWMTRVVTAANRRAFAMSSLPRALVLGLSTTLLPCGWLYTFAFVAAGTGSAGSGAMVMTVFWLGTVPALVSIGAATQWLTRRTGRLVPVAASVAMIVVGMMTVVGRSQLSVAGMLGRIQTTQGSSSGDVVVEEVPPCCRSGQEVEEDGRRPAGAASTGGKP